jgi:serine beta-lactamase-like protein LACTB
MSRILVFILFLIYSPVFSQTADSQNIDQTAEIYVNQGFSSKINQAQFFIKDTIRKNNIPGLSIAIAKNDTLIWAEGFGHADLENKLPVKINSKFRIGSISKTLTAMAIGKLLDDKKINLSDDFRKYVSYFPSDKANISIKDLVSHLSGIRDYNHDKNEYLNHINYNSIQESILVFQNDSLAFKPGTNYQYSSYNYTLLSAVIEGATAKPFLDYMQESVIDPLKLSHTVPDYYYSLVDHRARFYDHYNGVLINSPFVDNSNKWAGGGYLSTPMDLVKLCQSLLHNNFISDNSKDKLWTPAILKSGKSSHYGIGWRIDEDQNKRTFVHHGGTSVGGRSYLLMYPKEGLIVAITCNLGDGFHQDFALKIADLFHQLMSTYK